MKLNSRATNLRHLQDALGALSAAASTVRVERTLPRQATPPGTPLPPSPEAHPSVLMAAVRAAKVGATDREIAAAALLPRSWVRTVRYQAALNAQRYSRSA